MFAKLITSLFLATFAIPAVLSTPLSTGVNVGRTQARAAELQMTPEAAYDILTRANQEITHSCSELRKAAATGEVTESQANMCGQGFRTALTSVTPVFKWLATYPKIPSTMKRHGGDPVDSEKTSPSPYCANVHKSLLGPILAPLCEFLSHFLFILDAIPTFDIVRQTFVNLGVIGLIAHLVSLPFLATVVYPVKLMTDPILNALGIFL